jgi:hypothetical protein
MLLPLAVVVGWLVVQFFFSRAAAERALLEAVAALDRKDTGWRFEDLEKQRPALSDRRNGALRVRAASALLPPAWPLGGRLEADSGLSEDEREALEDAVFTSKPSAPLTGRPLDVLRSELSRLQAALVEARKLVDYPDGRYPIVWKVDFFNTSVEEVQQSRWVCVLLAYDAFLRAQDGDTEGAWLSGHAAVNVGRAVGDEPDLICQLVRAAEVDTAVHSVERSLAWGSPGEHAIERVQRLLEREDEEVPALIRHALRGRRALVHRMLEAYEAGRLTGEQMFGQMGRESSVNLESLDPFRVPRMQQAHAAYLRDVTALIEATDLPFAVQRTRIDGLTGGAPICGNGIWSRELTAMFLASDAKVLAIGPRQRARLRGAIAALAAERYRKKQGRWPDSLKALTPDYLARVPADPYDGAPLRFRRLADGLVIYSIGPDLKDNGGNIDRANPKKEGTDIGFRLWDVAQRRHPAVPAKK